MQSHGEEQAYSPTPSHTEEEAVIVPEKTTKRKTSKSTRALGIEFWGGWDILGLFLSLAILIAIIVITSVCEGKEQPKWKYMSLNTLLSWLSVVCKACILFPASATLSQLKWVWFAERKRPLSDLRVFDSASRGVYGSAGLLWKLRLRHFAVLGALATILSVGFEPFVQNLVHYSARLVEDSFHPAELAYSSSYDSLGPMETTTQGTYFVDNTLKANVYNSIFNVDLAQPWAIPHYTCTTGNCTWGPVPSIAMRALCSDVTNSIDEKCVRSDDFESNFNCTVSLPNGIEAYHSNDGVRAESNALAVGAPNTPIVYTNHTFLVLQRIEAAVANTVAGGNVFSAILRNGTYVATECALEPIVRSSSTFIDRSRYREHTLAEWDSVNKFSDIGEVSNQTFGYVLVPDWNEDLGMRPGQNFTITPNARQSINDFITGLFSGFADTADLVYSYRATSNDRYATADAVDTLLYGNISGCNDLRTERFHCAMNNIASANVINHRTATTTEWPRIPSNSTPPFQPIPILSFLHYIKWNLYQKKAEFKWQ